MAAELKPAPEALDRDMALFMAKMAEQAERYEEMVKYMKRIISNGITGDELTVEERNLISVGYKNMMSVRRSAWRTVQQFEDKEKRNAESDDKNLKMIQDYKQTIADEVFNLIKEVIDDIVNMYTKGPQKAEDTEVYVFFKKMEGDYNRYGAEITHSAERASYKEAALKAYTEAQKVAKEHLPSTNPIALGLALNFSVFYYEICEQKDDASKLAKEAFDQAIDNLDTLNEEAYKDSTLIMQLLKDNLTLWNETEDDEMEVQDVGDEE